MKILLVLQQLLWVETPTNPTLKVVDIAKVSALVKKYSQDIIIAVDNTFLSAYFQVRFNNLWKYLGSYEEHVLGAQRV